MHRHDRPLYTSEYDSEYDEESSEYDSEYTTESSHRDQDNYDNEHDLDRAYGYESHPVGWEHPCVFHAPTRAAMKPVVIGSKH
jgi:hypothetical protein